MRGKQIKRKIIQASAFFGAPFLWQQRNGAIKNLILFRRTAVIRLYFGFVLFLSFYSGANKKKEKVPKRKKNQRNHLEFARILVRKFLGTRPQKFASKIQQFYDTDKQLRCNYAPSGHTSLWLVTISFFLAK